MTEPKRIRSLQFPVLTRQITTCCFAGGSGAEAESQITAFEDTWHWNLAAEATYNELINEPDQVGRMIESFRQCIGNNQMMAYLVMMAVRLKELHRVRLADRLALSPLRPDRSSFFGVHLTNDDRLQNTYDFPRRRRLTDLKDSVIIRWGNC